MTTPTAVSIGPYQKLVLLGGGELLLRLARWAQEEAFGLAVVTSPRHAGEKVGDVTFEKALQRVGVEYMVADKLEAGVLTPLLGDAGNTFSLSLGAAWILSERLIRDVFCNNLFNVHGTRLPQNRGGGGFSWQILTGNRFGFCNVHKMEAEVDTGDIVFSREFLYPPSCRTPREYSDIYIARCFDFLTELLQETRNSRKTITTISQPEYLSSYWPRLDTQTNGWIDWRWAPEQIERFICAFDDPYAGAHTLWRGKRVYLKKVSLNLQDGAFHPFQSGIVFRRAPGWMCVAAGHAALVIENVADESGADVRHEIRVGDRFHTPPSQLDEAARRVVYSPEGIKVE